MPVLHITTQPSYRDVFGRFAKANQQLLNDKREMLRRLGRRWVEIAREEAPVRKGDFRKSIHFRTFEAGQTLELRGYSAEPLGRYIREGTDPHVIRARRAKVLRFLWPNGPRSSSTFVGFHFYPYVNHPGTKPNPYHQRAYSRWQAEAGRELRRITVRYRSAIT